MDRTSPPTDGTAVGAAAPRVTVAPQLARPSGLTPPRLLLRLPELHPIHRASPAHSVAGALASWRGGSQTERPIAHRGPAAFDFQSPMVRCALLAAAVAAVILATAMMKMRNHSRPHHETTPAMAPDAASARHDSRPADWPRRQTESTPPAAEQPPNTLPRGPIVPPVAMPAGQPRGNAWPKPAEFDPPSDPNTRSGPRQAASHDDIHEARHRPVAGEQPGIARLRGTIEPAPLSTGGYGDASADEKHVRF